MPDLALDLRHLQYAFAVAEHGSFRRTANALNISQSTVSRRIQLLEARLGVPLFERSRLGTRLTYAGQSFLKDAEFATGHLRRAINDLVLVQRGTLGELRLGLSISFSRGFLSDLLGTYRARYPNVEVKLEEAASRSSTAGVLTGRLDAAFISGVPPLSGCSTRLLQLEDPVIALPFKHALNAVGTVKWEDLREEIFLIGEDEPGRNMEDYLIRNLSAINFRPKIYLQKVGQENLLNMVEKGFGITLTTRSAAATTHREINFVHIVDASEQIPSSVVWAEENQNPALKKLLEICVRSL